LGNRRREEIKKIEKVYRSWYTSVVNKKREWVNYCKETEDTIEKIDVVLNIGKGFSSPTDC